MSDDTVSFGPVAERLESAGGTPLLRGGARSRRTVVAVVGGLGAVAVAGACFWAWQAWFAQGPQPSEALPGNTLAYVSVDLDPPGPQKVAALGFLRKFPSLKKELGLDNGDDVRRRVFEEFAPMASCDSVKYADDIEPWVGKRAAFAVVDQAQPELVVVLEVNDKGRAHSGLDALLDCAREGDQELGYVLDGDWAVLARSEKVARLVVEQADKGTLADDQGFKDLTGETGDPGVVTLYAAPEAGPALLQTINREPAAGYAAVPMLTSAFNPMSSLLSAGLVPLTFPTPDFESGSATGEYPSPRLTKAEQKLFDQGVRHLDEMSEAEQNRFFKKQQKIMEKHFGPAADGGSVAPAPGGEAVPDMGADVVPMEDFPQPEIPDDLRQALEDFSGLGGVVRFKDGGVELEMVSDRLEGTFGNLFDGDAGNDIVSALPDGTAFAYGAGFSDGWANKLIAQLSANFPFSARTPAETLAAFEKSTGLDVPGDVEALGGDNLALSAGEGFNPFSFFESPAQLPLAARITGDPDQIEAALAKIRAALPERQAKLLLSRRVGDDVLVGANADYLTEVARAGHLGDTDRFRAVVPNADKATSVFFVNFDQDNWFVKMMGSDKERADAEPLEAFGFTVWADGDRERTFARLTTED